jgi:hypothetical protein
MATFVVKVSPIPPKKKSVQLILQCQLAGKAINFAPKIDLWINREFGNSPQLVEGV